MKFQIDHLLPGLSLQAYEQLYFDEAFNVELCAAVGLQRALVSEERSPERLRRAVRVQAERELPTVAQRLLKTERIEYVEHVDYVWGSYHATWRTVPSLSPALVEKIRAEGTLVMRGEGDGVRRVVEGDIAVAIFGVGPVVEKLIIADVEASYQRAAEFTRAWVAKRR